MEEKKRNHLTLEVNHFIVQEKLFFIQLLPIHKGNASEHIVSDVSLIRSVVTSPRIQRVKSIEKTLTFANLTGEFLNCP